MLIRKIEISSKIIYRSYDARFYERILFAYKPDRIKV